MKKGFHVIWVAIFVLSVFAGSTIIITPVKALGTPQIVSVDPSSSQPVGTCIKVTVKIDGSSDYGSMHVRFANEGWQESSELQFSRTFCTGNYGPGYYIIRVEARSNTDNSWSNPTSNEVQYQLTAPAPPPGPSKGPDVQFSFNPSGSQTVGNSVSIHVVVNSNNPGATKITVSCGGVSKIETSEVQFDSNWNTNGCDSGTQQVMICSRSTDDPNWANSTCQTQNYSLSPATVPIPTPGAKFWTDSNNIQSGQCTTIHWQTDGADSVNIDGNSVSNSGDQQVCPNVTKKYSLTATNQSGSSYRNLSIVVSGQSGSSSVVDHFQTGDIIQIGSDIYVIVNGERRHVPNPETLDALGITRSQIDNKGFTDSDLRTIPQGSDVPDVNRDPSGFAAFKAQYFSNTSPIATAPPVQVPPNQPPGVSGNSSCQWGIGARVGLKAGSAIRTGSGYSFSTTTIVPSDNWQVDIIDGPRYAGGVTWWDISRKNLDGGGTGWVFFEQAGTSGCSVLGASSQDNSQANNNSGIQPQVEEYTIPKNQPVQTEIPQPQTMTSSQSKICKAYATCGFLDMGCWIRNIQTWSDNRGCTNTQPTVTSHPATCDTTKFSWLTPPITCEPSNVNVVTEIGMHYACIQGIDTNPFGYYMTHTIYTGWILKDAKGIESYGWFEDKDKRKSVIGPAIIVTQTKVTLCEIPTNP